MNFVLSIRVLLALPWCFDLLSASPPISHIGIQRPTSLICFNLWRRWPSLRGLPWDLVESSQCEDFAGHPFLQFRFWYNFDEVKASDSTLVTTTLERYVQYFNISWNITIFPKCYFRKAWKLLSFSDSCFLVPLHNLVPTWEPVQPTFALFWTIGHGRCQVSQPQQ